MGDECPGGGDDVYLSAFAKTRYQKEYTRAGRLSSLPNRIFERDAFRIVLFEQSFHGVPFAND
jgi:hypothetical protein